MSKASKDYQKIIKQIEDLKERCNDTEKAAVQEAMDIISDYEKATAETSRLIMHYETMDKPIHRSAVWCCPNCGKRIRFNHSHCHYCGKRIGWDRKKL